MDSARIGWSARLTQHISKLPPDVTFKFPDGDVPAHKMVLAMASSLFQDMFVNKRDKQIFVNMVMFLDRSICEDTINKSVPLYQTLFLKQAINEVIMEVSTKSSFQIMIDAIYDIQPVKNSLREKSFSEMFSVLHLVTKCEIPFLEMDVKEAIACFPIQETCPDCSQSSSQVPQIDDDGLLRFAAENGDHSSMEDELNIQKCRPCFSFLPLEIKTKILSYLCDNAAIVAVSVCTEWAGILVKRLVGQHTVLITPFCPNESSNGFGLCLPWRDNGFSLWLWPEEMRMGFQLFIEKLTSDLEESKLVDMELNYLKIPYDLSKDFANALCRIKTVWLGSHFPLNKVMISQVLENIHTRVISMESFSSHYFCDWRDLLKPADLKTLADKMKTFVLIGNFTPDQTEAVKYLTGVKVGYNVMYKK